MGEEAIPRKASPKRRPARWSLSLAPSSDERISTRAAAGDEAAFTEIYERYHQPLYRYCRSILRNDQDAEDALQSTMTSALTALRSSGKDIALRPWLFRVAHNESISLLRKRRPNEVPADEQALLTAPSASEPGEALERRERLADLVKDLDSLAVRQRSALLMRELSGLSIEEIAGALSTTPAAAKQALFEARTALRERVEGRSMNCDAVSRMIFEGDGRVLRGRKVKSHLASCKGCTELVAAMRTRSEDLHALAPALPAVAASAILTGLLGHGSGSAAGAGAAGAGAGAAGGGAGAAGGGVGGGLGGGTGGVPAGLSGGAGSASVGAANGVSGAAGSAAAGAGIHIGGALAVKATIGVLMVAAAAGGATQLTSSGGRSSGGHATQLRGGATDGGAPANGEGSLSAGEQQGGTAIIRHAQGAGAAAGAFAPGLGRGLGGAGRGRAGEKGSSTAHHGTAAGSAGQSGTAHRGQGLHGEGHSGSGHTSAGNERGGAHSRGAHSEGRGSKSGSGPDGHLRGRPNGKHSSTRAGDRRGAAGGTSHRLDSQRTGGERSHPREGASHPHRERAGGNPPGTEGGTSSGRSGAPSPSEGRSVTEREHPEGSASSDNAPASKAATGGSETRVTVTRTRSSETALPEAAPGSPSGAR